MKKLKLLTIPVAVIFSGIVLFAVLSPRFLINFSFSDFFGYTPTKANAEPFMEGTTYMAVISVGIILTAVLLSFAARVLLDLLKSVPRLKRIWAGSLSVAVCGVLTATLLLLASPDNEVETNRALIFFGMMAFSAFLVAASSGLYLLLAMWKAKHRGSFVVAVTAIGILLMCFAVFDIVSYGYLALHCSVAALFWSLTLISVVLLIASGVSTVGIHVAKLRAVAIRLCALIMVFVTVALSTFSSGLLFEAKTAGEQDADISAGTYLKAYVGMKCLFMNDEDIVCVSDGEEKLYIVKEGKVITFFEQYEDDGSGFYRRIIDGKVYNMSIYDFLGFDLVTFTPLK